MLYNNKNTHDLSKSIIFSTVNDIIKILSSKSLKTNSNFNIFLLDKIQSFKINPEKYQPILKTKIPDGSPIGNFSCDY